MNINFQQLSRAVKAAAKKPIFSGQVVIVSPSMLVNLILYLNNYKVTQLQAEMLSDLFFLSGGQWEQGDFIK